MEQGLGKPVPGSRCHGVPAVVVKAFLPLPALCHHKEPGCPLGRGGSWLWAHRPGLQPSQGCWGQCLLWGECPGALLCISSGWGVPAWALGPQRGTAELEMGRPQCKEESTGGKDFTADEDAERLTCWPARPTASGCPPHQPQAGASLQEPRLGGSPQPRPAFVSLALYSEWRIQGRRTVM